MDLLEFLQLRNIKNLTLIGEGLSGKAYSYIDFDTKEKRVLKETTSKTEIDFAKIISKSDLNNFEIIYEVVTNTKYGFILQEYLLTADNSNLFRSCYNCLENHIVKKYKKELIEAFNNNNNVLYFQDWMLQQTPKFLDNIDFSIFATDKFMYKFCLQFIDIIKSYIYLSASDLHMGNLGLDYNDNLKAFDVDIYKS